MASIGAIKRLRSRDLPGKPSNSGYISQGCAARITLRRIHLFRALRNVIIDLPAQGRFVMVRAADRSRKEEND